VHQVPHAGCSPWLLTVTRPWVLWQGFLIDNGAPGARDGDQPTLSWVLPPSARWHPLLFGAQPIPRARFCSRARVRSGRRLCRRLHARLRWVLSVGGTRCRDGRYLDGSWTCYRQGASGARTTGHGPVASTHHLPALSLDWTRGVLRLFLAQRARARRSFASFCSELLLRASACFLAISRRAEKCSASAASIFWIRARILALSAHGAPLSLGPAVPKSCWFSSPQEASSSLDLLGEYLASLPYTTACRGA
jgi:hypothetical protein